MIAKRRALWCSMALLVLASTFRIGAASGTAAALIQAARSGNAASVGAEIARGANANATEADGTTALHWAAHRNDVAIVDMLIRAGASAQAANRYGVRPISLAAVNGGTAVIKRLLDAGADPNTTLAEDETVLMTASRSGVVDAVKVLLDHGADVNRHEKWRGQTALMWAAAEGHSDVIRVLIAAGADLKARSTKNFTALLFAAREGRIDAVRTLLDSGSRIDESLSVNSAVSAGGVAQGTQQPNLDAFLLASGNAHFELAAMLLDRGVDPNESPRGWSALHQVSWLRKMGEAGSNDVPPQGSGKMGSLEFVKTLVAHGAAINARVKSRRLPVGASRLNFTGATPFLLAARTADLPLMRLLLDLGADPNLATDDETTPLLVASGVGSSLPGEEPGTDEEAQEAIKLLMKLGNNVNAVDHGGNTAMHGAAYKHLPGVVKLLGESGATIDVWNHNDRDGHTPFEIAAGIQRGMNFVFSTETAGAIRTLMTKAGVTPPPITRQ